MEYFYKVKFKIILNNLINFVKKKILYNSFIWVLRINDLLFRYLGLGILGDV